ncbi:hypothetical protein JCM19000A_23440 [Silvimonas sp. JCM 19000]
MRELTLDEVMNVDGGGASVRPDQPSQVLIGYGAQANGRIGNFAAIGNSLPGPSNACVKATVLTALGALPKATPAGIFWAGALGAVGGNCFSSNSWRRR